MNHHLLFDNTPYERRRRMCKLAEDQGLHVSGCEARALTSHEVERMIRLLLLHSKPRNMAPRSSLWYRCSVHPENGAVVAGQHRRKVPHEPVSTVHKKYS